VSSLATEELVALMWRGSGVNSSDLALARELVGTYAPWRLAGLRLPQVAQTAGVGRDRALRLACALELGARATRPPMPPRVRLGTPEDVAALCAPRLAHLPRERVVALLVDGRQRLLSEVVVSEGWSEGCPVDPREVFAPALGERAAGVVLVHNHPSGDPTPSTPDRELTSRLRRAGEVMGIKLVDHVVVAGGGFSSMAKMGLCA
jgi:DNA repair protein RadC